MTLKEYWTKRGGTLRELASHLGLPEGTSTRTVQRYVEHERLPDNALIRQIAAATSGKVQFSDWPDHPERRPKRERVGEQAAA